jgi:hypothetical protein
MYLMIGTSRVYLSLKCYPTFELRTVLNLIETILVHVPKNTSNELELINKLRIRTCSLLHVKP